ncbi:hypothetical protein EV363DRAFT_1299927 [Boletus edulis]|nr:hypothetical protein EV363DRAFT_1299927 [Boletus edulis]
MEADRQRLEEERKNAEEGQPSIALDQNEDENPYNDPMEADVSVMTMTGARGDGEELRPKKEPRKTMRRNAVQALHQEAQADSGTSKLDTHGLGNSVTQITNQCRDDDPKEQFLGYMNEWLTDSLKTNDKPKQPSPQITNSLNVASSTCGISSLFNPTATVSTACSSVPKPPASGSPTPFQVSVNVEDESSAVLLDDNNTVEHKAAHSVSNMHKAPAVVSQLALTRVKNGQQLFKLPIIAKHPSQSVHAQSLPQSKTKQVSNALQERYQLESRNGRRPGGGAPAPSSNKRIFSGNPTNATYLRDPLGPTAATDNTSALLGITVTLKTKVEGGTVRPAMPFALQKEEATWTGLEGGDTLLKGGGNEGGVGVAWGSAVEGLGFVPNMRRPVVASKSREALSCARKWISILFWYSWTMATGTFPDNRASGERWALNEWNRSTVQRTARWSAGVQAVGMVWTRKDFPLLGPPLVVHLQVKGWAAKKLRTNFGTVGGVKRRRNVPVGKVWYFFPMSEKGKKLSPSEVEVLQLLWNVIYKDKIPATVQSDKSIHTIATQRITEWRGGFASASIMMIHSLINSNEAFNSPERQCELANFWLEGNWFLFEDVTGDSSKVRINSTHNAVQDIRPVTY